MSAIPIDQAMVKRATGPTTAAGKAICSANRITHGLLSKRPAIAAGESAKAFRHHFAKLSEAYKPQGYVEVLLVEHIASNLWRLTRGARFDAKIASTYNADGESRERLARYERSLSIGLFKAMRELERLQDRRAGKPPAPEIHLNLNG